jgi:hypothetical protein
MRGLRPRAGEALSEERPGHRCVGWAGTSCSRRWRSMPGDPRSRDGAGGPRGGPWSRSSGSALKRRSVQRKVRSTSMASRPSAHQATTPVCRVAANTGTAMALHPAHVHAPNSIHRGWLHRASHGPTPRRRKLLARPSLSAPVRGVHPFAPAHGDRRRSASGSDGNGSAGPPVGSTVPMSAVRRCSIAELSSSQP